MGRTSDVGKELPVENSRTLFTGGELGLLQLEHAATNSFMGSEETLRALYPRDPPTTLSPLRTKQTEEELMTVIRSTVVTTREAAREMAKYQAMRPDLPFLKERVSEL